jgi:Fe-S oxidoreductase/nitrate reductase gamma subunit
LIVPFREIFWNISLSWLLYVLAAVVVLVMVYTLFRRFKMWHIGQPDSRLSGNRLRRWQAFISTAVVDGLLHRKFLGVADNLGHRPFSLPDLRPQDLYAGLSHFMIFFGCLILLIGTAMDVVSHYIYDFLLGPVFLAHAITLNVAGVIVLVGVLLEIIRRYGWKPARLDNRSEDLLALLAIGLVTATGYLVQAARLAYEAPAWAWWTPFGYGLAFALSGLDKDLLLALHRGLWWFHVFVALGAMSYVALRFNRLWHLLISPLNVYYRNPGPPGTLMPLDLEKAQSFGVNKIEDFSWKHILDLDACTRCGRCQDHCPAYLSGKPLSPKKVVQDLKANWLMRAPELLKNRRGPGPAARETDWGSPPGEQAKTATPAPLAGGVIGHAEIWNCTTCLACQEVCPVWIEPLVKINELRRNLVLEQCVIPETAEGALRSIEDRGHPWRGTPLTRTSWTEGLDVPYVADHPEMEYLFWVGCTEALEDRSLKIARAIAQLLKLGGLNFAILGDEESCCGDPARRLGNEYLYQMQVQNNITILQGYGVRKIVTGCPHCYHSLRNDYPQFGGQFEVIHHSQLIARLLQQGRLGVVKGVKGVVTYHDACYLGRYNNEFEAPRQILQNLPDLDLVEMERNRERNFCCGAGGGHLWLEEQKAGERINVMRTEQAMKTGAQIVATACPYCLQMFQDGIKTKEVEQKLRVMDVAELLAESAVYHPSPPTTGLSH